VQLVRLVASDKKRAGKEDEGAVEGVEGEGAPGDGEGRAGVVLREEQVGACAQHVGVGA
jgi:hypothetical protein